MFDEGDETLCSTSTHRLPGHQNSFSYIPLCFINTSQSILNTIQNRPSALSCNVKNLNAAMDIDSLREKFRTHGQEHVLDFWDDLDSHDQESLYSDLESINLADLNSFFSKCMEGVKTAGEKMDERLQPVPQESLGSIVRTDDETLKGYEEKGTVTIRHSVGSFT